MIKFEDFYYLKESASKGSTEYGCLMAVFPNKIGKRFIKFAKTHIKKTDLAEDGDYENEPHVTILFGFHGDFTKELKSLLGNWGELNLTLGKVSRFSSKEKDVLKIEVESKDIKKLHGFLMEHYKDKITTDYPKWKGHLTLAYVKHGACKELDGDSTFNDKEFKFNELVYSTPGMHKKTTFPIS
jgi:2'-5' RNA ligase